jgi:anti-sigma-K factor RskA
MFNVFDRRRQPNAQQVDELLSAYVDGLLRPDERKRLEARLEREPALRDRLEGMRFTVAALADLPELDVPRNFILTPSMVATPGTARPPRRRWNWPIFGWATAVATLLLLFVLAGDFFVITPSLRPEPANIVAQERLLSEPTEAVLSLESQPEAPLAGAEELPVELESEKEAVTVAEVEDEATGERIPAPEGAPAAGTEPPAAAKEAPEPTPAVEATRGMFAAETPTADGGMAPTAVPGPATAAPSELPVAESEAELLPSPSLTPPLEQAVGEEAPPVIRDTAQAVAAAPLEEAPAPAPTSAKEVTEGVPLWLRLLEIVLALVVVSLAVATVMVRRRAV